MPGYERSRIVGMSEEDLEEFTCGICLEVFIKPTSTQCCGQTFCFDCINEWLQENDTCPNDRQILTTDQLKPSPKIVTNLLNNMKIKCDFHDKGCEVVVKINDLEKHKESVCAFNPSLKCENCGEIKLNHSDKDCIKRLVIRLGDLQKVQIENDSNFIELLMKYEKLQIEYDNIKSLNDGLKNKMTDLKHKNCEFDNLSNNLPVETPDKLTKCGVKWTTGTMFYRCFTCGLNPQMALCIECFKKGNHKDHNYKAEINVFPYGFCDCGDYLSLKEQGFCKSHGSKI